jgi:hypothetical protein
MNQAKKVERDLNKAKMHGGKLVDPEDLLPRPIIALNRMLQESKTRTAGVQGPRIELCEHTMCRRNRNQRPRTQGVLGSRKSVPAISNVGEFLAE